MYNYTVLLILLQILARLMQQINRFVINKNTQHVNAVYLCNFNKKKMVNNNIYRNLNTMKENNNKKKITIRY